ncbi:MAG: mechanosensitive ion channel [Gemmiger sp.]|nr:mechanosensitive ion channel [Gemmiger sp.]
MDTIISQLEIMLKTNGIQVAQVLVTGVGGVLLVNFICHLASRFADRSNHIDSSASDFIIKVVRILLYIGVFFAIAWELGLKTDSLIAELGVITVAISLALKDTISSLANGIMIVTTKPFVQGDHVVVGGVDAVVKSIHLFSTVLTTYDNQIIIVPNQSVINGSITNYSSMPTRRVSVVVNVAYGSDVEELKRVLANVVRATAHILKTPAPFIRMTNMGASSLDFTIRVWAYTEHYMGVLCDLNEGVYKALNKAGIEIPFNQLDVHLRDLPRVTVETAIPMPPESGKEAGTDA